VLASGPLDGLQRKLRIGRRAIAMRIRLPLVSISSLLKGPSISALTYYGDRPSERIGLCQHLPRRRRHARQSVLLSCHDVAWARAFRENPRDTLFATMPSLRRLIGDIEIVARPKFAAPISTSARTTGAPALCLLAMRSRAHVRHWKRPPHA